MSARVYALLLRLYPVEMRRRWGEEMAESFQLQLADDGLRAWFDAIVDLFRVALPLQATREGVVVPLFSVAGSCSLLYALIWTLGNSVRLLSFYHHMIERFGG